MNVLAVMPGEKPKMMELDGSLRSMQAFVGGTIEAIYPFDDPVAIVCHGEGKLLRLPPNRALRDSDGTVYDFLCGPFFVCGLGEDDFDSLPPAYIQKYTKYFEKPELLWKIGDSLVVVPY